MSKDQIKRSFDKDAARELGISLEYDCMFESPAQFGNIAKGWLDTMSKFKVKTQTKEWITHEVKVTEGSLKIARNLSTGVVYFNTESLDVLVAPFWSSYLPTQCSGVSKSTVHYCSQTGVSNTSGFSKVLMKLPGNTIDAIIKVHSEDQAGMQEAAICCGSKQYGQLIKGMTHPGASQIFRNKGYYWVILTSSDRGGNITLVPDEATSGSTIIPVYRWHQASGENQFQKMMVDLGDNESYKRYSRGFSAIENLYDGSSRFLELGGVKADISILGKNFKGSLVHIPNVNPSTLSSDLNKSKDIPANVHEEVIDLLTTCKFKNAYVLVVMDIRWEPKLKYILAIDGDSFRHGKSGKSFSAKGFYLTKNPKTGESEGDSASVDWRADGVYVWDLGQHASII